MENLDLFQRQVAKLRKEDKSALKVFAASPTASNGAYIVGYMAALRSCGQIDAECHNYIIALCNCMEVHKGLANDVFMELACE